LIACGPLVAACSHSGSSLLPASAPKGVAARHLSSSSCTWSQINSPSKQRKLGDSSILAAVAVRSSSDAWAAGDFYDYPNALYHTLAEHWNGSEWKIVSSLDAGTEQSEFFGVTVAGQSDAWAVGYSRANGISAPYYTLIEHWDGHKWSIQQSDTQQGVLNAVSAESPTDVWAVGTTNYPGYGVIEHWNGKKWNYTKLRIVAEFRAVAAVASNDVWAVGEKTVGYADKTLTFHFDGTRWDHVPSPSPLHLHYSDQNWLTAVVPVASNDVWALGIVRNTDYGFLDQPLSLHWDGRRWRVVKFPPPGGSKQYNSVWGGTALSSTDVWAVGQVGVNTFQTMAVQWNGKNWAPAATPAQKYANLLGAAPDGTGGVWAVGDRQIKKYVTGTLVLRCT
jgi:hypothetical protein